MAAPLPVAPQRPTANDAPAAWVGGVSLYRDGVFSSQVDWVTCVSASAQMMLNITLGRSDHSGAGQLSSYAWGRGHNAYAYAWPGLDPEAWVDMLRAGGGGPYTDLALPDFDTALRTAARHLRLSGKPVGLLVSNGGHSWVMSGFTATADPAATDDFQVTSVDVLGPLYPQQQRNGYDMAPNTRLTRDQFSQFLTPYKERFPTRWSDRYVVIAPSTLDRPLSAVAPTSRVSGVDRFATAAAISAATFDPGAAVAFIATGENYPDALAGAAAAGKRGGPILLVSRDSIPTSIAGELARLKPAKIVILGGTGVVSDALIPQLSGYASSGAVERLAGDDRYATAAAISAATFDPGVAAVYLATGGNFPDALVGAAAAGKDGAPVLLATASTLPPPTAAELGRLRPGKVVVLGGQGAISDSVAGDVAAAAGGAQVVRLAGADRFGTAQAVSAAAFGPVPTVYVATGDDFPDALAAAPAAIHGGGAILIVRWAEIPAPIATELDRLKPAKIIVVGGSGVVSDAVTGY